MKEYLEIRAKRRRTAAAVGVSLTVAAHVCALTVCSFNGLKYLWPPPQETTFLIDFTEEPEPPVQKHGNQPRSENPDPESPVKLVQKSESSVAAKVETRGEPEYDPRATFPGMAPKDSSTASPQTASEASANYKEGANAGNTAKGPTEGRPNARLKGRSTVGNIPSPTYNVQERGTVVVSIWVDNYGKVQKAIAGADGTTVTDNALWAAARKAAMETHFNMEADAPALQEGTITYIFNLK